MQLLFLGTGTSFGVPMIGCDCDVCRSNDPHNKRTRASVLMKWDDASVLVDTSVDLRAQALRHGIDHIDAILFTHAHADHVHGMDDVRAFSARQRHFIPAHTNTRAAKWIRAQYAYAFDDTDFTLGWGVPRVELHEIAGPTRVCGTLVTPVPIQHGARTIYGYRVGRLAYLTDCSGLPEASLPLLENLHTLVLGALRHEPHPTHFSLSEAIEAAGRIGPHRTFFTHVGHNLDHAATEAELPDGMHLAYDGLELEIPD